MDWAYSGDICLQRPLVHTQIDGGASIPMEAGRSALAGEVHVDGEERLPPALDGPPLSRHGLPALSPRRVGRIDAAGVIPESGPPEDLVRVEAAALPWLVQLDDVRAVEVRAADVPAGLAAVGAVLRLHLGEVVLDAAGLQEALRERGEREVGADDAVVGGAGAVLHLLEEYEVGDAQLVDDLLDHLGEVGAVGGEVLGVVGGYGDAIAGAFTGEAGGTMFGRRVTDGSDVGERQYAVESKGIVDDASNIAIIIAHLGIIGVGSAIKRRPNDNTLGVGI